MLYQFLDKVDLWFEISPIAMWLQLIGGVLAFIWLVTGFIIWLKERIQKCDWGEKK